MSRMVEVELSELKEMVDREVESCDLCSVSDERACDACIVRRMQGKLRKIEETLANEDIVNHFVRLYK